MTAAIEDIAAGELARRSLAEAAAAGVTFGERGDQPFVAATLEERLDEIDALYEPRGQPVTFAGRAPADPARVAPPVRELPGGDAFAELFGPAGAVTFGLWARVKELYRRVRAFLARLRDGVFGLRRELVHDAALVATVKVDLGSDVTLALQGAASDEASARIAQALEAARAAVTDALAVFAKVVEIIATVIRAAVNPLSAVRALWRALSLLYDELVKHFGA